MPESNSDKMRKREILETCITCIASALAIPLAMGLVNTGHSSLGWGLGLGAINLAVHRCLWAANWFETVQTSVLAAVVGMALGHLYANR